MGKFDIKSGIIGAAVAGALSIGFYGGMLYNGKQVPRSALVSNLDLSENEVVITYSDGNTERISLEGTQDKETKDGRDGKDGRGVEKIEMGTDGNLYAIYTDGTSDRIQSPETDKTKTEENKTNEKATTLNEKNEITIVEETVIISEPEEFVFDDTGKVVLAYVGTKRDVVVPDGVRDISDYAFSSAATFLSSVTLPSSVENIGECAFANCRGLKIVNFSNVKNIGFRAFSNTALSAVVLPGTVTGIGDQAFSDCILLEYADLGSIRTDYIPNDLFSGCPILSTVILPGSGVSAASVSAYFNTPADYGDDFSELGDDFVIVNMD